MSNPHEIYDLLQDYAAGASTVADVTLGLVWTYCEAEEIGMAMSPGIHTRTLPWAGALQGKSLTELAAWVRSHDPYQATVGMAAVNAGINRLRLLPSATNSSSDRSLQERVGVRESENEASPNRNNLAVFQHFLPQIQGKRIVTIGRYPGLDRFITENGLDITVLERQPGPGDLPDTASEYLLPEAEWVFITASTLTNKTFPRLAELSRVAVTVLMGPTTPWLPELAHFGIDYLAGVEIADAVVLRQVVREGGGVRLFDAAVRYRIAPLNSTATQEWTRQLIARTVQEKESLLQAMATW